MKFKFGWNLILISFSFRFYYLRCARIHSHRFAVCVLRLIANSFLIEIRTANEKGLTAVYYHHHHHVDDTAANVEKGGRNKFKVSEACGVHNLIRSDL